MVSKAAERSSRQRQESFCEPIAVMRCFGGMVPTVSRLVRIQKTVREKVISKSRFYNTFDYFGNKRKVRDGR